MQYITRKNGRTQLHIPEPLPVDPEINKPQEDFNQYTKPSCMYSKPTNEDIKPDTAKMATVAPPNKTLSDVSGLKRSSRYLDVGNGNPASDTKVPRLTSCSPLLSENDARLTSIESMKQMDSFMNSQSSLRSMTQHSFQDVNNISAVTNQNQQTFQSPQSGFQYTKQNTPSRMSMLQIARNMMKTKPPTGRPQAAAVMPRQSTQRTMPATTSNSNTQPYNPVNTDTVNPENRFIHRTTTNLLSYNPPTTATANLPSYNPQHSVRANHQTFNPGPSATVTSQSVATSHLQSKNQQTSVSANLSSYNPQAAAIANNQSYNPQNVAAGNAQSYNQLACTTAYAQSFNPKTVATAYPQSYNPRTPATSYTQLNNTHSQRYSPQTVSSTLPVSTLERDSSKKWKHVNMGRVSYKHQPAMMTNYSNYGSGSYTSLNYQVKQLPPHLRYSLQQQRVQQIGATNNTVRRGLVGDTGASRYSEWWKNAQLGSPYSTTPANHPSHHDQPSNSNSLQNSSDQTFTKMNISEKTDGQSKVPNNSPFSSQEGIQLNTATSTKDSSMNTVIENTSEREFLTKLNNVLYDMNKHGYLDEIARLQKELDHEAYSDLIEPLKNVKPYVISGWISTTYLRALMQKTSLVNEIFDNALDRVGDIKPEIVEKCRKNTPAILARDLVFRVFTLSELNGGNLQRLSRNKMAAVRRCVKKTFPNAEPCVWSSKCVPMLKSSLKTLFTHRVKKVQEFWVKVEKNEA